VCIYLCLMAVLNHWTGLVEPTGIQNKISGNLALLTHRLIVQLQSCDSDESCDESCDSDDR